MDPTLGDSKQSVEPEPNAGTDHNWLIPLRKLVRDLAIVVVAHGIFELAANLRNALA